MIKDVVERFRAARKVSTPLISIKTADPRRTQERILGGFAADVPRFTWDTGSGLRPVPGNKLAEAWFAEQQIEPGAFNFAPELLERIAGLPPKSLVVATGLSSFVNTGDVARDAGTTQLLYNLRDPFKLNGRRTLLLLDPAPRWPALVTRCIHQLEDPLPDREELAAIVDTAYRSLRGSPASAAEAEAVVDALRGLDQFEAEQALYLSVGEDRQGVDLDELGERKRKILNATPGMKVWTGGETFADVRGLGQLTEFLGTLIDVRLFDFVVWIDEIEKLVTGAAMQGDNTGATQAIVGKLLSFMENRETEGIILVGPAGGGKSLIAKAVGGEAKVPTAALDLGNLKAGLLGQTEEQTERLLDTIAAMSERPLFVATSNGLAGLPPELLDRFTLQTWFVDLLSEAERVACFELFEQKLGVQPDRPDHNGWSGRNIRNCVRLASRLRISERKAAEYIVPAARSKAEQIKKLRAEAHGRYLSASYPGPYLEDRAGTTPIETAGLRTIGEEE